MSTMKTNKYRDLHNGLELVGKLSLLALVGMRREAGLLLSSNLQGSRSLLLQLVLLLGKFSHIAVQKRGRG